jgi:hypothetical protein
MTEPSQEDQYDEVYDGPDPEVQSVDEARPEVGEERTLVTERLLPEDDTDEFEPPQQPSTPTSEARTPLDEQYGETIDDRLAQEQPEQEP